MAQSPEEVTARLEQEGIEPDEPVVEIVEEGEKVEKLVPKTSYSDIEIAAMERGWKPKNEFTGPMEEWVDAKAFMRQGELMDRIHNQNRQLKKVEKVLSTMSKQQKMMHQAGYEKAKRELRARYRDAVRNEDDALAEQIEEQLDGLDKHKAAADAQAAREAAAEQVAAQGSNEDFQRWVNRNDWFAKHPYMRSYAETVGVEYAQKNPGFTNHEVWDHVASEVRKKFPERFPDYIPDEEVVEVEDETRQRAPVRRGSPVESGGTSRGTTRKSAQRIELNDAEKQVARLLVRNGTYESIEEYAKDLVKLGGRK